MENVHRNNPTVGQFVFTAGADFQQNGRGFFKGFPSAEQSAVFQINKCSLDGFECNGKVRVRNQMISKQKTPFKIELF